MVKTVLSVPLAADGAATAPAAGAATGAADGEAPASTHATEHLKHFAVKCSDQYSIAWPIGWQLWPPATRTAKQAVQVCMQALEGKRCLRLATVQHSICIAHAYRNEQSYVLCMYLDTVAIAGIFHSAWICHLTL